MKRQTVVLLMVLFVFLTAGCGVKEKIEQKVGEEIAEKVAETALGDANTEVDIDGGKITVKDEEGGTFTVGGTEWPDIEYIPELKQGEIISASNDGRGNVMIIIENVGLKDFEDYLERCKREFIKETNEMQAEEYLLFEGKNAKGELLAVQYFKNDNSLSIIGNRESE